MGFLNRLIRQEVQGASPQRVAEEEQMEQALEEQQMMEEQGYYDSMAGVGGLPSMYTGGKPPGMAPQIALPPNLDHETMKIYLKPKTPEHKDKLKGEDRFWIYSDDVCSAIITSNFDAASQQRIEHIIRQSKQLQGCDNVDLLIMNLQQEAYGIVSMNKGRSDLPDHIRERLAPSVGMSLYGDANPQKTIGERPKESRALLGILGIGRH